MQIYNLSINHTKLKMPASCTLEQLHYAILSLFKLDYNQPYHFIDDTKEYGVNQTAIKHLNELSNHFEYFSGPTNLEIMVTSAAISSYLYPLSDDENLNRELAQDFLKPKALAKSDLGAIEAKFKQSLALFGENHAISYHQMYFYYQKNDNTYEISIYPDRQSLALDLSSSCDSVFKNCLNVLYDQDDDYFDISQFNYGEVLEVDTIAQATSIAAAINEMGRYQPSLDLDDFKANLDDWGIETATLDNFAQIPGTLQVATAIDGDNDNQPYLYLIYERIVDKQPLTNHDLASLCHQIASLTVAKLNQIGIPAKIEVNDENLRQVLLPLAKYNIEIVTTSFDLDDLTANPFTQDGFDGQKAQELMSKLIQKYGYDGLTRKIMSSGNLSMTDLMSLATSFKSNKFDPNDERLKNLVANLYEAFKDDL